jgi:hypothetical protein
VNAHVLGFIAAALAVGAGCATSKGAGPAASASSAALPARKVKIGRELPNTQCRDLGPIKGSRAGGEWAAADPKEQDTYGQLTSATLELGGDHALIRAVAKDAQGVTVTGQAFDCSGRPAPQAAAGGPAAPPPAKAVKVGRMLPHRGCRELGQIWGTGRGYWPSSEERMQDAYAELMSSTRSLGGDYALIDAVAGTDRSMTISGQAYDCSQPPPAEAASKPTESVEERLLRLEQLKTKGLITPDEYATRRRAILDGL